MFESQKIDSLLNEERRFPPSADFQANAIAGPELYEQAAADRLGFWAEQSRELLHWHTPFTEVLDWSNPPFAKWFADGRLNVSYNCLDRHVLASTGGTQFHGAGNFSSKANAARTVNTACHCRRYQRAEVECILDALLLLEP